MLKIFDFFGPYALIAKFVVIGLLVAAAGYALHVFFEHYREQGRIEVRTEYKALITKCDASKKKPDACAAEWTAMETNNATLTANNAELTGALGRQTLAVQEWMRSSEASKQATARVLEELRKRQAANANYMNRLRTVAATPTVTTKEKECEEAAAISADAADRRLRYFGATPARPEGPRGGNVETGTDTLRIGR